MGRSITLCLVLLSTLALPLSAQNSDPSDNWDNVLYFSNKVAWGPESWRISGEFQTRYKNDLGELEQWHIELVATYLLSDRVELVPDFRFTRKPDHVEYRPGFGVIYKHLFEKSQLVHQLKWQWDKENTGYSSQGVRYALFYNYVFSEKLVGTFLAGGLFEFGKDFTGFLGLRTGFGLAYVIDHAHSLNIGYFYGAVNTGEGYTNLGIPSIQIIINIKKGYRYLPAKYYSF